MCSDISGKNDVNCIELQFNSPKVFDTANLFKWPLMNSEPVPVKKPLPPPLDLCPFLKSLTSLPSSSGSFFLSDSKSAFTGPNFYYI